jgi:hypothetical protein
MGFKIPARQGVFKKIEMVTVMMTGAMALLKGIILPALFFGFIL